MHNLLPNSVNTGCFEKYRQQRKHLPITTSPQEITCLVMNRLRQVVAHLASIMRAATASLFLATRVLPVSTRVVCRDDPLYVCVHGASRARVGPGSVFDVCATHFLAIALPHVCLAAPIRIRHGACIKACMMRVLLQHVCVTPSTRIHHKHARYKCQQCKCVMELIIADNCHDADTAAHGKRLKPG